MREQACQGVYYGVCAGGSCKARRSVECIGCCLFSFWVSTPCLIRGKPLDGLPVLSSSSSLVQLLSCVCLQFSRYFGLSLSLPPPLCLSLPLAVSVLGRFVLRLIIAFVFLSKYRARCRQRPRRQRRWRRRSWRQDKPKRTCFFLKWFDHSNNNKNHRCCCCCCCCWVILKAFGTGVWYETCRLAN